MTRHETALMPPIRYGRIRRFESNLIPLILFCAALCQFGFYTWQTLEQPIVDMWGFRPAQTAISIPFMLSEGAWLDNVVPVFGEPWVVVQEFPLYQWSVAALAWIAGAPLDACGRLVSALFAVATLWPAFLFAQAAGVGRPRRFILLLGTLWLMAPVVVFWGRSFLIETTSVFLGLGWLAFYARFINGSKPQDYVLCLLLGILAAIVKLPTLSGFLFVGVFYTAHYIWIRRDRLLKSLLLVFLGGTSVILAAGALLLWGGFADKFLLQNPLASFIRASVLTTWYFGEWDDRWSKALWDWVIRTRDLPEAFGAAWYVPVIGMCILLLLWDRALCAAAILIFAYLSGYMIFPRLHMYNAYYQVENVIFLCGALVIIADRLITREYYVSGYALLLATILSQTWTLHYGSYGAMLGDDLHNHPYYKAGLAIQDATPPDTVIVGFGMGWGADLPYYARRRAIILANWAPADVVRQMLFVQRDRWFGGRKLGAVVDCTVFESQRIDAGLVPIREALKQELAGRSVEVLGSFYGATVDVPKCELVLPK